VKSINLASAHRPLADYAADLGDEILVLTKGDRAVAAIVPLKNIDRESLVLSQHPEFLAIIAQSRAELAAGRRLSLAEIKRAVLPKRTPKTRVGRTARKARRRRPSTGS
jgi:antitoxin (DNA-binding transcriptional repressor) of toxin-antitoxin stability system